MVKMTMQAGTWRPTSLQALVLDAALQPRERAVSSFQRWVDLTRFDDVDSGSYRVLPLVAARFEELDVSEPWSLHLRGILRRSWYENQLVVHGTLPAVDALHEAGIDVIVMKGGSLSVLAYPSVGARPMDDLDLLVREAQAIDALRVLLDLGWKLEPGGVPESMHQGQMSEAFRRIRHSTGLTGPAGHDIDLHWHATYAWCWPGADTGLWSSARPFELGGRQVRALAAADELIVACVHGFLVNDLVAPIRWVTDSVMLVRSGALDWQALVARARELAVEPQLALALGYLRRFEPVPDWVFAALAERRPGYFERHWFASRTDLQPNRSLAAHYGSYLRGARSDPPFRRYVGGLPSHVTVLLGCDSVGEAGSQVVTRGAARVKRALSR
jgi:hypothetical protein